MFSTFNMGVGMVLVVDPSVPRCWGATTLVLRSGRVVPGAGVSIARVRPALVGMTRAD
jgi:phosphoribosylaminoimidazole (AIR) synthetase